MIKVAVVPIDNRPICYDLISDILSIDKDIKLFMPEIDFLGGLVKTSNVDKIFEFLNNLSDIDYLIVSLDTIAYGGLIPSRRCCDSFETIKSRVENFKNIASKKAKKILAFSSIMRISNNNINEEEKEYWNRWGKRIFDWSYYLHKTEVEQSYNCVLNKIPDEILDDYIKTRERNFNINKLYLKWASENFFDTLIFSKDDCAEFGLNVKEANELDKLIKQNNITSAFIKTGADEIPLGLLSRALAKNKDIKINPIFIEDKSTNIISKYEDISIKNCVLGQINLASCKISNDADLTLLVNNFQVEQGDLVLGETINSISKKINFPNAPYFIADVNNANGSDIKLIEQLLSENNNNFFGYCGYNTSANTLGCAILCAIVKFLSIKKNTYQKNAMKKIQFIRLMDDYCYQAISRKDIRENAPHFNEMLKLKEEELNNNSKAISKFLDFYPEKIEYSLPWDRSFEIRIKVN